MATDINEIEFAEKENRLWSLTKQFGSWCRKRTIGAVGLFMVLVVLAAAILNPVIKRYDPNETNVPDRLQGPNAQHFFGTDDFGRDLWARIIGGAVISAQVGFISVAIGSDIGLVFGVISGFFGGGIDNLIQRITEIMLSIPGILLALALMATDVGSGGIDTVVMALSIIFIPRTVRVMRGSVLSCKENVYIDAARAIGCKPSRIMWRHITPNVMAPYLVLASSLLGTAILTEASLSFLGLGVPPPHPSWGRLLSGSVMLYAISAPWMVIVPGVAITWLVLGFNVFGDALRDTFDPKLRGR